ncbi:MAG: ABC transporter substrate-binding protein [Chloroflexota bacterium]
MNRKMLFFVAALALLVLALAACQPQTIEVTRVVEVPQEVVVTQVVTEAGEQVEVTRVVEVVVEPTAPPPPTAGEGETLRIAMISDITTTNYWAYGDPDASVWNQYVLNGYAPSLYTYSPSRLDWIPSLAADFPSELTQEGEVWTSTVPMKQNVVWSDGEPITAHDVAFTANVVLTLELGGNWASQYDATYIQSVEAVDDYTVKFTFKQAPGLAVYQFGTLLASVLPEHFWAETVNPLLEQRTALTAPTPPNDDPESEEYAAYLESEEYVAYQTAVEEIRQALYQLDGSAMPSAGGYTFGQWEAGAFAENVRNANYSFKGETTTLYANGAVKSVSADGSEFVAYGAAEGDVALEVVDGPYFNNVIYSIFDQDAAILALQSGEADLLYGLQLQRGQVEQLQQNPDIQIVDNPANGFRFLGFNFSKPPLDNAAVRQAINCVIDKDFLTGRVLQGAALPVYTPVPAGNAYWYNPDVTIFCQGMSAQERLFEAIRLLKEAGFSWETEPSWNEARGGSPQRGSALLLPDGTAFPEMKLLAPSAGYDPLRATTGVLLEQWMQDLGMPISTELTNFNNIINIVFAGGGEWDLFILGWSLTPYPDHVCSFFQTGAGFNVLNYSNADLDALCDQFLAATDLETARDLNWQIQELLATDLPYVYLFTPPQVDAYNGATVQYQYLENLNGLTGTQQTMVKAIR